MLGFLTDVLPPLLVGVCFMAMGALKAYGLLHGIEGGAGKPTAERLCGA